MSAEEKTIKTFTLRHSQPILIAGLPDPRGNVWTPEALRDMAAQKPGELRYEESERTLFAEVGVNVRVVDGKE